MLKRAVLHIGFEKTGTTSVLATFKKSRDALRDHGILFPHGEHDHRVLSMAFGRNPTDATADGESDDGDPGNGQPEGIEAVEAQIRSFDGHTVLFSAESLAAMPPEGVRDMCRWLDTLAQTVSVIAYVRQPVEQCASLSQQMVKSGHVTLQEVDASPRYREYRPRLEKYVGALGRESMLVVPFERSQLFGGSVQHDLLTRIGCPEAAASLTMVDRNESLTTPGVVLKSLMDRSNPSLRLRRRPLAAIAGPKFALTAAALREAEAMGSEDVAYLAEVFGVQFAVSRAIERGELADMFTGEVMRSLKKYGKRLEGDERGAFDVALEAIRAGDYYGRSVPTAVEEPRGRARRRRAAL